MESISAEQPVKTAGQRAVTATGETGWIQWVTRGIFDDRGQVIEYQGVGRDVTGLRLAQKALRDSEEKPRFLSSRPLDAQEEERRKIIRELHGSIGSSLVAVKMGVENARSRIASGEAEAELLDAPISWIQNALDEAGRMMSELRPTMLDDCGLVLSIDWYCRNFESVNDSIRVEKRIEAAEARIPEMLKIIVFRVMQEALNNIAKYSEADTVTLSLFKKSLHSFGH